MKYRFAVPLLLAIAVAMVWIFPYLPMTDVPEHMLIAKILSVYGHSNLGYEEFYTAKLPWNPYSLYFLAIYPLSGLLSIKTLPPLFLSPTFILTIAAYCTGYTRLHLNGRPKPYPLSCCCLDCFFSSACSISS